MEILYYYQKKNNIVYQDKLSNEITCICKVGEHVMIGGCKNLYKLEYLFNATFSIKLIKEDVFKNGEYIKNIIYLGNNEYLICSIKGEIKILKEEKTLFEMNIKEKIYCINIINEKEIWIGLINKIIIYKKKNVLVVRKEEKEEGRKA